MSAPDTNIETQKRQHRPALTGIWLGLAFVAVLFLAWLAWVFAAADDTDEANVVPGAPVVQTDDGPVEGSGATIVD